MIDLPHLLETAKYSAFEVKPSGSVSWSRIFDSSKSDNSPLTQADVRTKTNLPVLCEEGMNIEYEVRKSWTYYWLIDPLDGTREFVKKNGEVRVNIALINNNTPIAGIIYVPCADTMYCGSKQTGIFKHNAGNRAPHFSFRRTSELWPTGATIAPGSSNITVALFPCHKFFHKHAKEPDFYVYWQFP